MVCAVCKSEKNLLNAKDEDGNKVQVCETCFESTCEGFELTD